MIVLAKVFSTVITSVGSCKHVDTNLRLPLTYHMHVAMQNSYEYVKRGSVNTFFAEWNCHGEQHQFRDHFQPSKSSFSISLTPRNCKPQTRTRPPRLPGNHQ